MIVKNGNMRKPDKARVLIVLALGAALVGVAGYWVESEPANTDRYYLESSGGAVVFEHQAHVDVTDGCERCHDAPVAVFLLHHRVELVSKGNNTYLKPELESRERFDTLFQSLLTVAQYHPC